MNAATLPHHLLPLRWPLPALLAWGAAWCTYLLAARWVGPGALAAALALAVGALPAPWVRPWWRRLCVAAGFPASALALGALADWPAWVWALPLALLAAAYPLRAWRDAPFFPTPPDALDGLAAVLQLPETSPPRILDAGCGAGHGLRALAREWPAACLEGVEWSGGLAWLARWRVPQAIVRRGDMWALSWAAHDVVYLFQRPESMARAWEKARHEMRTGAFLVSLDFAVPGVREHACLRAPGRRAVWIYRLG